MSLLPKDCLLPSFTLGIRNSPGKEILFTSELYSELERLLVLAIISWAKMARCLVIEICARVMIGMTARVFDETARVY